MMEGGKLAISKPGSICGFCRLKKAHSSKDAAVQQQQRSSISVAIIVIRSN